MAASFLIPWKLAAQYGDAQTQVLVMLTVAALCNTLVWFGSAGALAFRPGQLGATLLLAAQLACLTLAGNYCSAEAVARMSGALLSVIQRAEVIVVAFMGALLLREEVRRSFWFGTVVSLSGLAVLSQRSGPDVGFDATGVAFGMAASVCFGTMTVLTRKHIAMIQPVALNALRLWMSVALWFVVVRRLPTSRDASPELLLYAGLAGFFGPFLSRTAGLYSARHVPANLTAFAGLATPVLTLLLAFVLIHDLPTQKELFGGAIMLAGISLPVFDMWWRASRRARS